MTGQSASGALAGLDVPNTLPAGRSDRLFVTHAGVDVRYATKAGGRVLSWNYEVGGEMVDVRGLEGFDETSLTLAESVDRDRHAAVIAAAIDRGELANGAAS